MIRSLALVKGDLLRNASPDRLQELVHTDSIMWIDIVDPTEDELEWVGDVFQLHPNIRSDLRRDDRRPTLMSSKDVIFLSLFQAILDKDTLRGTEIHCICVDNVFITVRNTASDAIGNAYEVAARNGAYWEKGVEYFLYLCLQYVIDSYYPRLDRLSLKLAEFEERILTKQELIEERAVYQIKQQLVKMRQMVAPQRELLSDLIGQGHLSDSRSSRELYHHLYERILRVYDVIDAQRDLWSNVMELLQRHEASQLNKTVNRLTVISLIFLPLTLLFSLLELNFYTIETPLTIPMSGTDFLLLMFGAATVLMIVMYFVYKRMS